jgi:peptidyl-prolyl cis-trans isomerase C
MKMKNASRMSLVAAVGLLALAGCNRDAPSGQVVATVDGEEVTIQEINGEIQAANPPADANREQLQRQALQRVIDRKLLVKAAKDKGIDRTPEYLAKVRRGEETLLAQTYAQQQLTTVPVPSAAELSKFMSDNASMFGQRQLLSLDQIRFAPPRDLKSLAALDKDKTMDQVAAHLTQLGIKFERVPETLDTGAVPPQLMQAIEKLPAGEPFVIPSQGAITVNVITGRKPVATDASAARAGAVRAFRQQKFGEILQQQINSLRSSTKITYQNGFGPPATPPQNAAAKK